jgi:hypothetical protein
MSDGRLSMQQVLARFDQAIGLETSPRALAGSVRRSRSSITSPSSVAA